MKYTQEQLNRVIGDLDGFNGRNSSKATAQFAKDARQAICDAYGRNWQTKVWSQRENVTEKKLAQAGRIMDYALENGVQKLVNGDGRWIVQSR